MNNRFEWHKRYELGVDFIDKEHRKLFSIMNKLFEYGENDIKTQWICQEGIKYFKGHAMQHFAEEEMYMASLHYEGYDRHRRLHDNFRKQTLLALEKELNETGYSPDAIKHFLGVCAGWLIGHTLTEDRAITGQTSSKWENLLPEEQIKKVSQTIVQLLNELFQLDSQVISEHYGGEKFGKGFYYRLVYSSKDDKEWEVILIFEERLLLATMGKMMGEQSDKVNVMLMNAVRYTARQFVDRIRIHFPTIASYEIKNESLLTYEQFQKIFGKQQPQCSLLFDTGEGYFAYCDRSPSYLQEEMGTTLEANNTTEEIKNYLKKEEENQKKKILVVDDSSVMRQAMQELLGNDYEVSEVSSGVAALQSIALNRPDLILLDYEMPVCDGGQVLEMLRSEKNMSDIPVIFLTGRGDPESIKKVMALKPAGYLLKNLKPEDIKANIDGFLRRQEEAKNNQAEPRKKILVVDDSEMMRRAMHELLGSDYEVSEASSGVAAIQSIALSRPNLILLDYEMPVCDGSQVLEMIRSEKDLTDIPVIFLTGRGDPESIKKVMALKPAGYLLKNLKPEDIKANIDGFLRRQKS